MNVTSEMISRYADGQASPEERAAVEAALRDDPQAAIDLDEFESLAELFGAIEPETVSEECLDRLYALDGAPLPAAGAEPFRPVEMAPVRRIPWRGIAAAAAVALLTVYGIFQLTATNEVTLREFARLTLDSTGAVVKTERLEAVTLRSGDALVAAPGQRITYRDPDGARVVLMPESRIEIGDPAEGDLFELSHGTALLTVLNSAEPRVVTAGGYRIRSNGANFGVRVAGADVRGAGATGGRAPEVMVAVRSGACEIDNGERQHIEALWCVRMQHGRKPERARIWESPLYAALLEGTGYQILPGFFSSETGVRPILPFEWDAVTPREYELTLTAAVSHWFVAEVEMESAGHLELVRTRPLNAGESAAEETTVSSPLVPAGRHVVAFPVDSFDAPDARVRTVEVPEERSRLVRLRLRGENDEIRFKIKASLWSARPPADASEVVR